jgi:hypothetical protein
MIGRDSVEKRFVNDKNGRAIIAQRVAIYKYL